MTDSVQGASPSVRPILFSASMVRALLDGRKKQTRRAVKGRALDWLDGAAFDPAFVAHPDNSMCPYGKPGDLLWVRETLANDSDMSWMYAADTEYVSVGPPAGWASRQSHKSSIRSIHMARWASRLTLEITAVRLERLQDIIEADALSEGVWTGMPDALAAGRRGVQLNHVGAYISLWEDINGPGSWTVNPWVWVLEFKVHRCNVDVLLARLTSGPTPPSP